MAGAETERTDSRVDAIGAGFNRLHQAHQGYAGSGVNVDVHAGFLPARGLDRLDDVVGRLGFQQRRHILDADRLAAEIDQLLGQFDKAGDGVQRAHRVADRALGVLAGVQHGLDGAAHVADVVERVEDAKDVHAVRRRLFHKPVDDGVLIVPVAQQVLPAE